MMCRSGVTRLYTLPKKVFYSTEDEGGMIYGVWQYDQHQSLDSRNIIDAPKYVPRNWVDSYKNAVSHTWYRYCAK